MVSDALVSEYPSGPSLLVKDVNDGICVPVQPRGEDHEFIVTAYLIEEPLETWPQVHVEL